MKNKKTVILKKGEETYVLVWVNQDGFYGDWKKQDGNSSIDTSDWMLAEAK